MPADVAEMWALAVLVVVSGVYGAVKLVHWWRHR